MAGVVHQWVEIFSAQSLQQVVSDQGSGSAPLPTHTLGVGVKRFDLKAPLKSVIPAPLRRFVGLLPKVSRNEAKPLFIDNVGQPGRPPTVAEGEQFLRKYASLTTDSSGMAAFMRTVTAYNISYWRRYHQRSGTNQ